MPISAELIAKVKRRQDKKRADKAQGVEPKPKRQNVGGSKAAVAADVPEKLDKSAKTGKNSMAGLTSLMVLSLTARMRAIESMVMWVYNMLTEDELFDCMAETGKEHQKAIDKAKKDGTSYTPDAPIHVMQFATALEIIRNDLPSVSDYCDTLAENSYAEAVKDVLYFRRVV